MQCATQVGSQYVFDFGVNFAGWFELTATESRGTRIVMKPGESLNSDGSPAQAQWTTGSPIFDAYTFAGKGPEKYRQKFMYHGLQYLMVNLTYAPAASDLKGYVIRADNEAVGSQTSSNKLFNDIHRIIDRSIVGNMYSVMTDCPHREKWGWLEQTHLVFDPIGLGYDVQAFGKNMARTMANAQRSNGLIPSTTPEYLLMPDGYSDDPNWGSTMILMPLKLYQYYGEVEVLSQNYGVMQRYISYLQSKSAGNLLNYGLGDWACLDCSTPIGLAATMGYAQSADAMATIAAVLGKTADAATYRTLHSNILSAFHNKYFNASTTSYAAGAQGSIAVALDIGAVPTSLYSTVLKNLVQSVTSNAYHVTVGEITLPSLFRALHAGGRDDVLFKMMNLTTMASYGYMITQGATSLWEGWSPHSGTRNHFMLGYGDTWLAGLGGMSQQNNSIAYRAIELKPVVVGDLTSAASTYRSAQGMISASWVKSGKSLKYDVTVPVGCTALVYLDGTTVTESGRKLVVGQGGILSVRNTSSASVVIGVGSGSYSFVAS